MAFKFLYDLKWIAKNLILLINTNFTLKTYVKTVWTCFRKQEFKNGCQINQTYLGDL